MRSLYQQRTPAPRESQRFIDHDLNELISFGGLPYTRGEAIVQMQRQGHDPRCIDRWLQGCDDGRERERKEAAREAAASKKAQITTKAFLA